MRTQVEEKFSDFYEKWMSQLEDLLQLLLIVSTEHSQEAGYKAMVNKLTSHHKNYYKFKWVVAHEDILAFFSSPIWLSPLENVYLWITGWKPSMAFRLVESLKKVQPAIGGVRLSGMTEEQVKNIEALRLKIKVEEETVEREMERLQVAVADRKMVEVARMERRVKKNGSSAAVTQVNGLVEVAVQGLLDGLERVMKMADCVRLKTLKGLLDILSPMQCVNFLAAKSMLQIKIRKWGQKERRKLLKF